MNATPSLDEAGQGVAEHDIRAAIVIPFRDRGRDPYRQANLDRVVAWWRMSPWPVTVVDDGREGDAQFNRSAAYNLGAQLVDADVIVYAESDMILGFENVLSAIWMAHAQPGLVVPFTEYRYLSEDDSEKVRHGLNPAIFRPASTMDGGRSIGAINVVSRETLELVGGYTEATEGSWYDDTIMGHAFEHCAGPTRWVAGPAYHLYHLPGWTGSHRTPEDIAATKRNRDLWLKVRRVKDPAQIRALLHPVKVDRCGTCGMAQEPPDEPIEPGDYWKLPDPSDPRLCSECHRMPTGGDDD